MKVKITAVVLLFVLVVAAAIQFFRPLPKAKAALVTSPSSTVPGQVSLDLPSGGQSAVAVSGVGMLSATGNETAVPIASLTKMMTAYLVLQQHPLKPYQDGPSYTITPSDVTDYQHDKASGDSVVKVVAGDKWTELQMLQGLLLPSGDNMATTLAKWISGSPQAFIGQMNATAKKLGMTHTTYLDASGVNPGSASTATDQLKLAEAVMNLPAFREIVDMPQADLPGAGIIYNVDNMVGKQGIVGIKTGSTMEAGGCFASAMYEGIGGQKELMLGVVLGQQSGQMLASAINDSVSLLHEAKKFPKRTDIPQNTVVAQVTVPWQGSIPLETVKPVSYIAYPGMTVKKTLVTSQTASGTDYKLKIQAGEQTLTIPLSQTEKLDSPSLSWRFLRGNHIR